MLKLPARRSTNFIAAAVCFLLLFIAAVLQYKLRLAPCPLCVIQRIIILVLGVLFLMGGFVSFKPIAHRLYYSGIFLLAGLGVAVASRHVWLQTLPTGQVTGCGPSLTYILDMLPPAQAFQFLFAGRGHCGAIDWQLLGLSIPDWTLVFFIMFAVVAMWQLWRK